MKVNKYIPEEINKKVIKRLKNGDAFAIDNNIIQIVNTKPKTYTDDMYKSAALCLETKIGDLIGSKEVNVLYFAYLQVKRFILKIFS